MTENQLPTMNGAMVLGRWRDTIFVRIPRELQEPIKLGCSCPYCVANPTKVPHWDTLAIGSKRPDKGNDYAWTVHMPDPSALWDNERKERDARLSTVNLNS